MIVFKKRAASVTGKTLKKTLAYDKSGLKRTLDTEINAPDKIVLDPQTEYVRKFTEEIDKARVVHAKVLVNPEEKGDGEAVDANATVQDLARMLIADSRERIPVVENGNKIGAFSRHDALDVLLGAR